MTATNLVQYLEDQVKKYSEDAGHQVDVTLSICPYYVDDFSKCGTTDDFRENDNANNEKDDANLHKSTRLLDLGGQHIANGAGGNAIASDGGDVNNVGGNGRDGVTSLSSASDHHRVHVHRSVLQTESGYFKVQLDLYQRNYNYIYYGMNFSVNISMYIFNVLYFASHDLRQCLAAT